MHWKQYIEDQCIAYVVILFENKNLIMILFLFYFIAVRVILHFEPTFANEILYEFHASISQVCFDVEGIV